MACCVFFAPRWSQRSTLARIGYRQLTEEDAVTSEDWVTVVVGKERRVFMVESFVLEKGPFRVLLETLRKDMKMKNRGGTRVLDEERVIFVDVDAILFEHMLWLMYNDWSSLHQLNLEEIIEFYAQDY